MMIKVTGEVTYRGKGFCLIETAGVGYRVLFPQEVLVDLVGSVSVFTHEVVRENERELYGFTSMDALELFWKLIGISGVGAKTSQKIVLLHGVDEVRSHIMKGDIGFLTQIPGIGTKIAQKIILELKGVLAEEPVVAVEDREAEDALVALGYSRRQAREALEGIQGETTEDKLKSALQSMRT